MAPIIPMEIAMDPHAHERSALRLSTQKLRQASLAANDGERLGSEDEVVAHLAVSRATLKQAARLLEQEGLLRVKRGVNGGYYAARPTEDTLKSIASAYLQTIDVASRDIVAVTTVLWLEVVRRASEAPSYRFSATLRTLGTDLERLADDPSFQDVDAIEQRSRRMIFDAIDCRYIELIMRINQAFGAKHPFSTSVHDHTAEHRAFVIAWRKAKRLELEAIADGDTALAEVAARNCRTLWNRRVTMSVAAPGS